jgi:cobalt/nickel transport system permease protein
VGLIVHIPDGFLATPVWAVLDVAAVPAVWCLARRAQRGFEETRAPLLGVMGAFVFAAQMINFPVGVGTSGHLVGAALLAIALGPAAAGVVMTAILAIQALVFQDGGVLALGANVWDMAVLGVLAGYWPYRQWGAGGRRRLAVFLAGALSVMVSALAAIAWLLLSGVRMPGAVLGVSLGLFVVSAAIEGVITLAVVEALEAMRPGLIRQAAPARSVVPGVVGLAALLLAVAGVMLASTHPDGIEKLARTLGIEGRARVLFSTPLAAYETHFLAQPWLRKASAGVAGLALVYGACVALARVAARRRGT